MNTFSDQTRQQRNKQDEAAAAVDAATAVTHQWPEHRTLLKRDLVQVLARSVKMLRAARVRVNFWPLRWQHGRMRWQRTLPFWHPKFWWVRGQIFVLWWQNYWVQVVVTLLILGSIGLFFYLMALLYRYLPDMVAWLETLLR
ncbi:MAG: hypothetical protein KF893_10000 [Caldilineaceae bacterium]|nr:hypothetical protein [Caldilineaceae bacterium]